MHKDIRLPRRAGRSVSLARPASQAGPSAAALTPGSVPSLRQVGQVASGNGVASQLATDCRPIPPQAPGHLGLGEAFPLPVVDAHSVVCREVDIGAHTTLLSS